MESQPPSELRVHVHIWVVWCLSVAVRENGHHPPGILNNLSFKQIDSLLFSFNVVVSVVDLALERLEVFLEQYSILDIDVIKLANPGIQLLLGCLHLIQSVSHKSISLV